MSTLQALLFAVVQGITELFPVSSVAHGVLTPFAFGWTLSPEFLKQNFLPFVVMLHLGTATALLIYFWRDWWSFLVSLFGPGAHGAEPGSPGRRDGGARRRPLPRAPAAPKR